MSGRAALNRAPAAEAGKQPGASIDAAAALGGRAALRIGAVFTLLVVMGCGEDGGTAAPGPVPGLLSLTLASPNGDEGAAVIESPDPGIMEITESTGDAYLWMSGGTTRIVVVLDTPGSIGLTLRIEDLLSAPHLRVIEVADGSNLLRPSLSGYELLVSRAGRL